jgi:transposase
MTGPLVPVGILNLIRAFVGIPHHRFNLSVKCSRRSGLIVGRRAETDRVDVERLLRSLMAYLRGEPKPWTVLGVLSVAEED